MALEDWIKTEVGYVRASEVAAVVIETRHSSYFRESKGYEEEIEWNVLVAITKGGAKIDVRDERFGMPTLEAAAALVGQIEVSLQDWVVGDDGAAWRVGS